MPSNINHSTLPHRGQLGVAHKPCNCRWNMQYKRQWQLCFIGNCIGIHRTEVSFRQWLWQLPCMWGSRTLPASPGLCRGRYRWAPPQPGRRSHRSSRSRKYNCRTCPRRRRLGRTWDWRRCRLRRNSSWCRRHRNCWHRTCREGQRLRCKGWLRYGGQCLWWS